MPACCPQPRRRSKRRCMRPGPLVRNPYLNFLRDFRKKCCGMTAVETVIQGAKAWGALSKKDKLVYVAKACSVPKRRAPACKPKRRKIKHRCISKSRRRPKKPVFSCNSKCS